MCEFNHCMAFGKKPKQWKLALLLVLFFGIQSKLKTPNCKPKPHICKREKNSLPHLQNALKQEETILYLASDALKGDCPSQAGT